MSKSKHKSGKDNKNDDFVISYQMLRRAIGYLGIGLPIALIIGLKIAGHGFVESSISSYYHTIMRNIFVGVICAFAFFLFAYRGYNNEDNRVANLAALFALGVAFFPMIPESPKMGCDPSFLIPQKVSDTFHFIFAAGFFLTLSYFSIFLFTKSEKDQNVLGFRRKFRKNKDIDSKKVQRNIIYIICGFLMLVCISLCAFYILWLDKYLDLESLHPIFWLESIALWAFGLSWLIKGIPYVKNNETKGG